MSPSAGENQELAFEISFYEGILAEDPDFVDALIPLAEAYTKAGRYEKGLEADQRLARLCPKNATVHYNLACSHALTGHADEAMAALEHAVELGYCDADFMLKDKDLASLHDDERFARLIARFFPKADLDVP